MLKNIFRNDLELEKKWWHRLFKIVFLILLCFILIKQYTYFLEDSYNYYSRVDDLENRITDKVLNIEDLLGINERFHYLNRQPEDESFKKNIYCSKKLYEIDNLKDIIKETSINNFDRLYINKNKTSLEEISIFIKKNNIKCITKDNAEIDFLNPMIEFNEFGFYKKNRIQYLKDSMFLWGLLIYISIYLFASYIVYYKIILYIIYGNSNKKK